MTASLLDDTRDRWCQLCGRAFDADGQPACLCATLRATETVHVHGGVL